MTTNDELPAALVRDHQTAPISDAEKAMLRYVEKLTRKPGKMEHGDVDRLREVGFSDAAILDICQVTGYYAFVNRLADGLGVELEDEQ